MKNCQFTYRMRVRDYECDVQGIVNNANYLHYLEVGRHEFIRSRGLRFIDLHDRGIECVVARINMSLHASLRPDEEFDINIRVEQEGVKYEFHQEIVRASDSRICVRAVITVVALINGKLGTHPDLDVLVK